ncbi:MAG: RdgB/HAM1 family non-canonical purine NTP pyrophosphatase [Moraxellaceae bacterium]|jgi:XTP/dITP diphosphohydrolase|nr:RdgB/HAM1 family non-canonical purine NTP pyrophosphatase [Moraxellaceae bacterium]
MQKIVLATGNAGKLKELRALLADQPFEILSQKDLDVSDADETGLSFIENAILKARHAARLTGLPALADDSGLCVDALGGAPGIYSARYAGMGVTDADNNRKLLETLRPYRGALPLAARFVCVLALVRHADDPLPLICQGEWEGEILDAPQGDQGFGYDPLFWVSSDGMSSAELPRERKNMLSHRGQALVQLKGRIAEIFPS